jgi:hypothetical protein
VDKAILDILGHVGITSGVGAVLILIFKFVWNRDKKLQNEAIELRKKNRDMEMARQDERMDKQEKRMDKQEESLKNHVIGHGSFEKELIREVKSEVKQVYDRLNPIAESVKKIEGFMEAQQMMSNRGGQQQ